TAAMSRPTSSKQRSTLHNRPPRPGLETNRTSLHQTQGDSVLMVLSACSDAPFPRTIGLVNDRPVSLTENAEDSDVPCIGVFVATAGLSTSTRTCPTLADTESYAVQLTANGESFVLGFGLEPGEEIAQPDAIEILTSDEFEVGRFFAIALADAAPIDSVTVEGDVGVRTIEVSQPD
ncbi:MAG: hypothetical protein ABJ382_15540, partial [Ilumatobacter sp.]